MSFSALNIGTQGIRANSAGMSNASNNATNANTPGYTRRAVEIQPMAMGTHGMGPRALGSSRITDSLLQQRFLGASAYQGKTDYFASSISVLDDVFAEGPGRIGDALDTFHQAISDLTTNPNEVAARNAFLARGKSLGQAFGQAANTISDAKAEANLRIRSQVASVNGNLDEIASLGRQITQAEANGTEASDLRDQRDELVRQVSSYLPVRSVEQENGQIDLYLAGSVRLVSSDGESFGLESVVDANTGDVSVTYTSAGAEQELSELINSGSIGGLIQARDEVLSQAQADLDQLAFDVVTAYNDVHSAGVGLDGVVGRNLFDPLVDVEGAAAAFQLSEDVVGNPDAVALALDPNMVPGDNRNALALLDVTGNNVAQAGSMTLQESYGDLISFVGSSIQGARFDNEFASASLDQVISLHDSISGVSTDEEMVDLMKFQRGFQAAMKVIQTADEMLQDLMNLKR